MSHQSTAPNIVSPNVEHPEQRERFGNLRRLVRDDRRRRQLIFGVCFLALVLVALLATLVRISPVLPIDVWTTHEFQEHPLTKLMYAVSIFGYSPWATVTVAVGTLLVGVLFGIRDGAYLLAITVIQGLINAGVKLLIGRPRPINSLVDVFVAEHGNSFPSGHVMFYTVFFGFIALLALTRLPQSPFRWIVAGLAALLIALVGPSRIVLGSHWLSDVIAAYLLGFVLLAIATEVYLAYLAPSAVHHERGLIRTYDEHKQQEADTAT